MSELQLLAPGLAEVNAQAASLPHVLLVVDCFPKTLGGGERIALRLASLLPRAGFRTSLLTLDVHPETSFQPDEAPCPVYLLPLRNTYGLGALRGALSLRRFLLEQQVCVVQTFFESSDLWAGSVVRLFSPARLFWSRRDMGILRQKKHSLAYRLLRRMPHGVFAVSQRVAEHVAAVDGVDSSRIHVIYNGLDLVPGQPQTILAEPTTPHITTIGNVRPVKGHDLLLEAAAKVIAAYPGAHFTVAGDILDTAYYRTLCRRAEQLGLGDRFRFLGKITNLAAHLETADVFVLPSRSEGFSNALIEAMANALPVVATDVGGNCEAVQEGIEGWVVPPEDSEGLAAALLQVLQNPARARAFGQAAQQKVAERFTSEAMLTGVARVFRKSLGE